MSGVGTTVTFTNPSNTDEGEGSTGGAVSALVGVEIDIRGIPAGGAWGAAIDVAGIAYDQSSDGGITIRDMYQGIPEFFGGLFGGAVSGALSTLATGNLGVGALAALAGGEAGGRLGAEAGAAAYDSMVEAGYFEGPVQVTVRNADGTRTEYHHQSIGQGGSVWGRTNIVHTTIREFDENGDLISSETVQTEITGAMRDSFGLNNSGDQCFLAHTPIQMWPLDRSIKPRTDGGYDEELVLSKVWEKPISEIKIGDVVVAYDARGRLAPRDVLRTMQNTAMHILDFWGTGVTPGHAYLCGEGRFKDQHVPIIDILRTDGAIVRGDGKLIRAATGCEIGSDGDKMLHCVIGDTQADGLIAPKEVGQIRLGTRFILEDGRDVSVMELIIGNGGRITQDGYIETVAGGQKMPFRWTFSEYLPKPEDYILRRSDVDLRAIYLAGEWEQIGTRMHAPVTSDGSALYEPPRSGPNIPPAFAKHPDTPMINGGGHSILKA